MGKRNKNIPLMLLLGMAFILYGSSLFARGDINSEQINQVSLLKTAAGKQTQSMSNVGNWGYWLNYDGESAHDPFTDGSGGYYPRGTAAVLYMDGLIWGGYVRNPAATINPRVGGWGYRIGTQPGWIEASGKAVDPANPRVRLYRIRTDWATLSHAQVKTDAAELNNVKEANVTESMTQAILDQYAMDWNEWPVDLGAPWVDKNDNGVWDGPDVDEPGIANADQVVWIVLNDLNSSNTESLYGSPPIGLEVQVTLWQYNQAGASLGQIVFKKYKVINKSGFAIDSMFVGQFSDPDLGDAADDYVAANVEKSLQYVYNAYASDSEYGNFGLAPAAGGFDFFQGPIVPSEGDTAVFDLKYRYGYKNLPMTSAGYFAAGGDISDPPMGDYKGTKQWYNMLNGYTPTNDLTNPVPYTHVSGPNAGLPTLFPLDGDPVAGTGDLDSNPGDRRMFSCSGPFTLANGDTQEVVLAVVGGLGDDNISSISDMLLTDEVAQKLYNDLFLTVPKPPASPKVSFTELEKTITLNWGFDAAAIAETEKDNPLTGYNFEGYNVYQLPKYNSSISEGKRIATFDLVNGVTTVYGNRFDSKYGQVINVPVQFGSDKGIQRYFVVEKDYLTGTKLYPGSYYYFAVTAYNYNQDPQLIEDKALESSVNIMTITQQGTKPGVRYASEAGGDVSATHDGTSDGRVNITVIDPKNITGDDYQVFFELDSDTNSSTYGEVLWNLKNVTKNTVVVSKQPQTADFSTNDQPVVDGIQVKVSGPAAGIHGVWQTSNAAGPIPGVETESIDEDIFWIHWAFNADADYPTEQSNYGGWFFQVHGGGTANDYDSFLARVLRNDDWDRAKANIFEMRFTDTPSKAWLAFTSGNVIDVPFELWNLGQDAADTSDDYKMLIWVLDNNESESYDFYGEDAHSGASNDPSSDWVYWYNPSDTSPGTAGYDAAAATPSYGYDEDLVGGEVLARTVLMNWNGYASRVDAVPLTDFPNSDPNAWTQADTTFMLDRGWFLDGSNSLGVATVEGDTAFGLILNLPETGTTFRWITNKPNNTADLFSFSTSPNQYSDALAKADVKNVNVFPNPYYAYNSLEENRFSRFVTFNHLPQEATLRIFNLSGSQVRKLEKNDPSQFLKWDLKNETELPVASGIYVIHVDMKKLGTKVLKLVVIQGEQILKYY